MTPDQNPPKCPHLWVERVDGYFDCSFCKETCLDPEAGNQTPPVDTAALAAAAETTILPRPIKLEVGGLYETATGDRATVIEFKPGSGPLCMRVLWLSGHLNGHQLWTYENGTFYEETEPQYSLIRPIDPVPHTAPRISDESPAGLVMGALAENLNSLAPQAPEATSDRMSEEDRQEFGPNGRPAPAMWMADSRPLLAEIEKLSADRDAADKSLKAFVELEMEARKERDAARAEVSTLTDALSSMWEVLELLKLHHEAAERCEAGGNDGADVYDATYAFQEATKLALKLLEPPALVQALKGGEA